MIDDHVFIDVGIRGVHAGLRGMSRILKVLIDDHPVAFRPTSGSLLGLEMIPIRAIDRIELIRGPASALYGANAFLGVLQIVTRRGGDVRGGSLAARAGLDTHRDTIEVLHMLGSTDLQVARLFQRRIAFDTLLGGAVGTAAALRADGNAFTSGLETAITILRSDFDATSADVEGALALLRELRSFEVAPERPDISGSLNLLRELQSGAR